MKPNAWMSAPQCGLVLAGYASAPASMEGGTLTGATRMTLVTFDRDAAGSVWRVARE